ncbi:MAG: FeoB-associated Cys-rich membrane protein [Bacteroidales bacterium]
MLQNIIVLIILFITVALIVRRVYYSVKPSQVKSNKCEGCAGCGLSGHKSKCC